MSQATPKINRLLSQKASHASTPTSRRSYSQDESTPINASQFKQQLQKNHSQHNISTNKRFSSNLSSSTFISSSSQTSTPQNQKGLTLISPQKSTKAALKSKRGTPLVSAVKVKSLAYNVYRQFTTVHVLDSSSLFVVNSPGPLEYSQMSRENVAFFNHVYGENVPTEDISRDLVRPSIKGAMSHSSNHVFFVTGATSSGKSHLLIGNLRFPGLLLELLKEIFFQKNIREGRADIALKMSMSMAYIKSNQFFDGIVSHSVPLKTDPNERRNTQSIPVLDGITSVDISDPVEAARILKIAMNNLFIEKSNRILKEGSSACNSVSDFFLDIEITSESLHNNYNNNNHLLHELKKTAPIKSKLRICKMNSQDSSNRSLLNYLVGEEKINSRKQSTSQLPLISTGSLPFEQNHSTQSLSTTSNFFSRTLLGNAKVFLITCVSPLPQDVNSTVTSIEESIQAAEYLKSSYSSQSQTHHITRHIDIDSIINKISQLVSTFIEQQIPFLTSLASATANATSETSIENLSVSSSQQEQQLLLSIFDRFFVRIPELLSEQFNLQTQLADLRHKLNSESKRIVDFEMKICENILTSLNTSEFYLAKLQPYNQEAIQNLVRINQQSFKTILSDIYASNSTLHLLKQESEHLLSLKEFRSIKAGSIDIQLIQTLARMTPLLFDVFRFTNDPSNLASSSISAIKPTFQMFSPLSTQYLMASNNPLDQQNTSQLISNKYSSQNFNYLKDFKEQQIDQKQIEENDINSLIHIPESDQLPKYELPIRSHHRQSTSSVIAAVVEAISISKAGTPSQSKINISKLIPLNNQINLIQSQKKLRNVPRETQTHSVLDLSPASSPCTEEPIKNIRLHPKSSFSQSPEKSSQNLQSQQQNPFVQSESLKEHFLALNLNKDPQETDSSPVQSRTITLPSISPDRRFVSPLKQRLSVVGAASAAISVPSSRNEPQKLFSGGLNYSNGWASRSETLISSSSKHQPDSASTMPSLQLLKQSPIQSNSPFTILEQNKDESSEQTTIQTFKQAVAAEEQGKLIEKLFYFGGGTSDKKFQLLQKNSLLKQPFDSKVNHVSQLQAYFDARNLRNITQLQQSDQKQQQPAAVNLRSERDRRSERSIASIAAIQTVNLQQHQQPPKQKQNHYNSTSQKHDNEQQQAEQDRPLMNYANSVLAQNNKINSRTRRSYGGGSRSNNNTSEVSSNEVKQVVRRKKTELDRLEKSLSTMRKLESLNASTAVASLLHEILPLTNSKLSQHKRNSQPELKYSESNLHTATVSATSTTTTTHRINRSIASISSNVLNPLWRVQINKEEIVAFNNKNNNSNNQSNQKVESSRSELSRVYSQDNENSRTQNNNSEQPSCRILMVDNLQSQRKSSIGKVQNLSQPFSQIHNLNTADKRQAYQKDTSFLRLSSDNNNRSKNNSSNSLITMLQPVYAVKFPLGKSQVTIPKQQRSQEIPITSQSLVINPNAKSFLC